MEQNVHHEVSKPAHRPVPHGKDASSERKSTGQYNEEIPEDEIAAMGELAIAAREQMQKKTTPSPLITKYHRKTGRIRTPRETSDCEWTSSDDDACLNDSTNLTDDDDLDMLDQDLPATPESLPRQSSPSSSTSFSLKAPLSCAASPAPLASTCWMRTSKGKYAINQVKCPPCARRKKADKCRGGPPCGECWSRGRKTAEECQEWGEGREGSSS